MQTKSQQTPLEIALQDAQQAAVLGYETALGSLDRADKVINQALQALASSLKRFNPDDSNTSALMLELRDVISSTAAHLDYVNGGNREELETRHKALKDFSIVLFGITMAGKSTLMEILTDGDGSSIGFGAQRTTRDIRSYEWRGLKVTDVPGIGAFNGEKDEEVALNAVQDADLVLFLLSDNAPTISEADFYVRLRTLGKPVVTVCNIKTTIGDEDDIRLLMRPSAENFNPLRLNELEEQFGALVDQSLPGEQLDIIFVSLRAKYLSSRPDFASWATELEELSRFTDLENALVGEIVGHGEFLRTRSFLDGAIVPIQKLSNRLLESSARLAGSGQKLLQERRHLSAWESDFRQRSDKQIQSAVQRLFDSIRQQIPEFLEDHFNSPDMNDKWMDLIQRQNLDTVILEIQQELLDECMQKLLGIGDAFEAEFAQMEGISDTPEIKTQVVRDVRRTAAWITLILGASLSVAGVIRQNEVLVKSGAAVGLVGGQISDLFPDWDSKVTHRKSKLAADLLVDIIQRQGQFESTVQSWFNQELMRNVNRVTRELHLMTSIALDLANTQRELAWQLNKEQKTIHMSLFLKALEHLEYPEVAADVVGVARIPGRAIMLLLQAGSRIPPQLRTQLGRLLQESVWFVHDTQSAKSIIGQAIGRNCVRNTISLERRISRAHVHILADNAHVRARVNLSQQLTELHVVPTLQEAHLA